MSKSIIGSPYWMAPEVINKSGHDQAADIWSFGCCVIEMLTTKPPWIEYGKDPRRIMNTIKNTNQPPKYPEGISQECKDFLDYCFKLDMKQRPTSTELLYHPFVLSKKISIDYFSEKS
jgi:serine/threonine protein kinase